ncbi:UAA transporter family-domain-containing protein [Lanmaoa asiatica]|nr:UAA transporter family-domain-containing protein [Lanmaoa asiatica]
MLSLSDWITTLSLVFGGCCSNAITTERLTSENPHSGILITFFQFLIVSLYALPSQLVFSGPVKSVETNGCPKQHENGGHEKRHDTRTTWLPRLRKRRVPLLPYFAQVALFFVLSVLNNAAFAYDIPMSVHIVFRSGGMAINMLLGWLLRKKRYVLIPAPLLRNGSAVVFFRYTLQQVLSVFVVTIGIILTTLSASRATSKASSAQVVISLYAQGIAILSLALLLSGLLGLMQDHVFERYIKPSEAHAASDPLAQPSWQENMFYLHSLPLPLFYFSREGIATELARLSASPSASLLAPVPLADAYLAKTAGRSRASPALHVPVPLREHADAVVLRHWGQQAHGARVIAHGDAHLDRA